MGFLGRWAGQGWRGRVTLLLAVAACAATWAYGFWKGPTTAGLVFLPLGLLVFLATLGALALPAVSLALAVVAAITAADAGVEATAVLAAKAFLGFGLLSFAWLVLSGRWRR